MKVRPRMCSFKETMESVNRTYGVEDFKGSDIRKGGIPTYTRVNIGDKVREKMMNDYVNPRLMTGEPLSEKRLKEVSGAYGGDTYSDFTQRVNLARSRLDDDEPYEPIAGTQVDKERLDDSVAQLNDDNIFNRLLWGLTREDRSSKNPDVLEGMDAKAADALGYDIRPFLNRQWRPDNPEQTVNWNFKVPTSSEIEDYREMAKEIDDILYGSPSEQIPGLGDLPPELKAAMAKKLGVENSNADLAYAIAAYNRMNRGERPIQPWRFEELGKASDALERIETVSHAASTAKQNAINELPHVSTPQYSVKYPRLFTEHGSREMTDEEKRTYDQLNKSATVREAVDRCLTGSHIEKIDQEALKFNGGRKVDWAARGPLNSDEEMVLGGMRDGGIITDRQYTNTVNAANKGDRAWRAASDGPGNKVIGDVHTRNGAVMTNPYLQRVLNEGRELNSEMIAEMNAAVDGGRVFNNSANITSDGKAVDLTNGQLDYFDVNADPRIAEILERFKEGDGDKQKLLDNITLSDNVWYGVFDDTQADQYYSMKGIENLDDDMLFNLRMVSDLLNGYVERVPYTGFGSDETANFQTAGVDEYGRDTYPRVAFQNGNAAVNNTLEGTNYNSVRFHEIRHIVSAVRRTLSSRETVPLSARIQVYESDIEEAKAMLEIDGGILYDRDIRRDYVMRVTHAQHLKGQTRDLLVGELMNNFRILGGLVNGSIALSDLKHTGDMAVGSTLHNVHHPSYYHDEWNIGAEVVFKIVDETLSAIIQIQANGDLYDPLVQEMLSPLMKPYFEFSKKFRDMMPSNGEWDKEDLMDGDLSKYLLSGIRNHGEAKKRMRQYTSKSGDPQIRSFKEMMDERRRTYGPKDLGHVEKIDQEALKFNGGRKVDDLPQLRNEEELKALRSLVDSELVPKEVVNNTFGRDVLAERHNWVPPQYGVPEPETNIIDTNGLPKKERKAAEAHNNEEWRKRSEHHLKDQIFREMVMRRNSGSRIGSNQVKLTTNENGDTVLDLSLPADIDAENLDPKVMEQLMRFWDNNADTDAGALYRGLKIDGNSSVYPYGMTADTNSDKLRTIQGIENLDDDTLRSLALVSSILGRTGYSQLVGGNGSSLTPSTNNNLSWIQFDNGNAAMNSAFSGDNNSVRFHECRHAVSVIRNTLSNKKKVKVGVGVDMYESDADEVNGMLAMGAGKLFTDEGSLREYTRRVAYDRGLKRGTVNRVLGELVANCWVLDALVNGVSPQTLMGIDRDAFENPNITDRYSHGSEYYSTGGDVTRLWVHSTDATTEDVISRIVNETLSAMIQLEANGDLYKPIIQEMVGPFMPAYKEFTKKFLDMMPSNGRFDPADKVEANKALLSDKRNSRKAKEFIGRYTSKSAGKVDWSGKL